MKLTHTISMQSFLVLQTWPRKKTWPPRPPPQENNLFQSNPTREHLRINFLRLFRWCHFPQKSAVFLCYRRISSWQFLEVDNTRVSALGSVNPLFGTLMGRLFRGPFGWTLPSGHTDPVCPRYELPSSYQHGPQKYGPWGALLQVLELLFIPQEIRC